MEERHFSDSIMEESALYSAVQKKRNIIKSSKRALLVEYIKTTLFGMTALPFGIVAGYEIYTINKFPPESIALTVFGLAGLVTSYWNIRHEKHELKCAKGQLECLERDTF